MNEAAMGYEGSGKRITMNLSRFFTEAYSPGPHGKPWPWELTVRHKRALMGALRSFLASGGERTSPLVRDSIMGARTLSKTIREAKARARADLWRKEKMAHDNTHDHLGYAVRCIECPRFDTMPRSVARALGYIKS